MAQPAILALDVGSSSVRARLHARDLKAVPEIAVRRRYGWTTDDGAMEADAEALFEHVVAVIDDAVGGEQAAGWHVEAVCMAGFWHSLVGLDGEGRATTPVYGWGDARAAGSAAALRERLDARAYHRRTGCFLHPSYPAVRLAWLCGHDPSARERVQTWTSFGDYVEGRLLGTRRISASMASASGLFELSSGGWDEEVLAAVRLDPSRLPELAAPDAAAALRGSWRQRWPALREARFFPPLGDGACASVGSGALGPARPAVTAGTSAAVRVLRRSHGSEPVPDDLWCYLLDEGHRVWGGALSNGGNALGFLRSVLAGGGDVAELDRALANALPDAHGLTVVPSLVAERGYGWTGERGGAVAGLTLATKPADVAVAWLEAIAQRCAGILERLEARFGEAEELRASGGLFHTLPAWLRTLADATGRPVRLGEDPEETSRGAAIVAARSLGWLPDLSAPAGDGLRTAAPEPERTAAHRRAAVRRARMSAALASCAVEDAQSIDN